MKLTIIARSRDDFGVIVNREKMHQTKQSIFKVNISDADLHELTESRVDKEHLIEFAFNFLLERETVEEIQSSFAIKTITFLIASVSVGVLEMSRPGNCHCSSDCQGHLSNSESSQHSTSYQAEHD